MRREEKRREEERKEEKRREEKRREEKRREEESELAGGFQRGPGSCYSLNLMRQAWAPI